MSNSKLKQTGNPDLARLSTENIVNVFRGSEAYMSVTQHKTGRQMADLSKYFLLWKNLPQSGH
jgi:hypothetical protein